MVSEMAYTNGTARIEMLSSLLNELQKPKLLRYGKLQRLSNDSFPRLFTTERLPVPYPSVPRSTRD
jgi:hypothetical protein